VEFLGLQHRLRKTVVMVTHDLDEAIRLGERIALMRQGGHLEQYATPGELLGAPATPFVAAFVGEDRSLRRLAVVDLKASDAEAQVGSDLGPRDATSLDRAPHVRVGDSLRDALVAVLDTPGGAAIVVDDTGTACGKITAEGILAAARRSLPDS
jgi:osmoprotectant transport system ATP-binding protein